MLTGVVTSAIAIAAIVSFGIADDTGSTVVKFYMLYVHTRLHIKF